MDAETLARMEQIFVRHIPLNQALGFKVHPGDDGAFQMRLPYREDLVGNPETGVLHGGMITALLDATMGMSVLVKSQGRARVATLDLRIDYLKPATPGQDVLAEADCYKLTTHVAFVRALAHHGDKSDPIASAAGTFVIFTSLPRPR